MQVKRLYSTCVQRILSIASSKATLVHNYKNIIRHGARLWADRSRQDLLNDWLNHRLQIQGYHAEVYQSTLLGDRVSLRVGYSSRRFILGDLQRNDVRLVGRVLGTGIGVAFIK
jgi:hypothetical protein